MLVNDSNRLFYIKCLRHAEILALASYRLGKSEAAIETLAQAVAMAELGGSIRLFVEPCRTMAHQGDPMTDMLERLNQTRPGHTFTKQVLDACRAEARSSPSSRPSGRARCSPNVKPNFFRFWQKD